MKGTLELDAEAGQALELVQQLVGRGGPRRWQAGAWPLQVPSPELVAAAQGTLATAAVRWLATCGAKPRAVLRTRGGQVTRVEGRIWDPELNDVGGAPFTAGFTSSGDTLWRSAVSVLGDQLTRPFSSDAATKERIRKINRIFAAEPASAVGDHLACALFLRHVHSLGLVPICERRAASRLRAASPLARLFSPADEGPAGAAAALGHPGLSRAIELVMPDLSRAWSAAVSGLWGAEDRDALLLRVRTLRASAAEWLAACDSFGRLDLVDPVLALWSAVGRLPLELRARLAELPGVGSMAERQSLVVAVADGLDPAGIDEPLRRLALSRYGDDRYVESRLVAALVERLDRDAIRAALARLRGQLG